ncbi:hypothetical protein PG999_002926 [Apiospora kogelbergensis]|uniref:Uncharacterized protein n=1 Tax=Apiospora kogelbergensis TaxID=1337665 RepID=A0AAW0R9W9_9PEZI
MDCFNALRPEHLANKDFHYEHEESTTDNKYDYVGSWQLHPPTVPFPVLDMGPPTWDEEQRVLRAFWRLELFKTVRIAIESGSLCWPTNVPIYGFQLRNITTNVLDFYHVVDGYNSEEGWSLHPLGHYLGDEDPRLGVALDHDLEAELIQTAEAYTADNRHEARTPNIRQRKESQLAAALPGPQDQEWLRDAFGPTLRFFYNASCPNNHGRPPPSPIKHVSFEPFRRVGFAIWDERRMIAAGFLESPPSYRDFDNVVTAWRSILTKEMLDEIAEENARHHVSDSEQTDSDASDPGEIVMPRWVITSPSMFTYRRRKRARRRSRVRSADLSP